MSEHTAPEKSELGKKTEYDNHYNVDRLFPMPRQPRRDEIGVSEKLPFYGYDLWNHYEVSWLNEKGKPMIAIAEIIYGCDSKNIIESKSMKLYFNSFNNTKFKDIDAVIATVKKDLSERLFGSYLDVHIIPVNDFDAPKMHGINIDDLDVECSDFRIRPDFLTTDNVIVTETLCSDLLKSNCRVTNQPDWCSLEIIYHGPKINREGLLKYIVSFRDENEFHEQCIEKIFMHLMHYCKPTELTVLGRSTRRGGLDINSCRSTKPIDPKTIRNDKLYRQ